MWEKKRKWLVLCQCENYTIFTKFWLKKPGRVLLTKNHWIPKELHEVKTEWDKKINYCVEYPPKELPTKFSPFFGNWLSRATQHKAGPRSKPQGSSSTHHARTSRSKPTPGRRPESKIRMARLSRIISQHYFVIKSKLIIYSHLRINRLYKVRVCKTLHYPKKAIGLGLYYKIRGSDKIRINNL